MPTEYIPASVPVQRVALRRRVEFLKARLGPNIPKRHTIAWVSFFWGATLGRLLVLNDFEELRDLLPSLGYSPEDVITDHPTAPEMQAFSDTVPDDEPVWKTRAQDAYREVVNTLHFYSGQVPDDELVAWHGYLRGHLEAGSISLSEYNALVGMLPAIENNPVDLIAESAVALPQPAR